MDDRCLLYVAPPDRGTIQLEHTVPELLDRGCQIPQAAICQWQQQRWQCLAFANLRRAAEELALGLRAVGLQPRDRIGICLPNGLNWVLADLGSLLAGLVTVPIGPDSIDATTADADLQAIVTDADEGSLPPVPLTIATDTEGLTAASAQSQAAHGRGMPSHTTIESLRQRGRQQYSPQAAADLKQALQPEALATIVYTTGPDGRPRGVMLSHRSLTGNILAAFSTMADLRPERLETALTFLPLHHIFARTFLYGHLGYGHRIYLSSPRRVMQHLRAVEPTIFITVPRLLEKIHERLQPSAPSPQGSPHPLAWLWKLAHRHPRAGWWAGPIVRTAFRRVRLSFGRCLRHLVCGGAPLQPETAVFFANIGLPISQGYGLTESSSVLTYARDRTSSPSSVGRPIPGVEIRLSREREVLAKSLYAMEGYYHRPEATAAAIDRYGWLHTGDLGSFSDDGSLVILGYKKELFKLSTGKYVAPKPIEAALVRSELIDQALVVGPGQKFCSALIFPSLSALAHLAPVGPEPLDQPHLRARYQAVVDRVNDTLPRWSTIKRFSLLLPAPENLPRQQLYERYRADISALYDLVQIA